MGSGSESSRRLSPFWDWIWGVRIVAAAHTSILLRHIRRLGRPAAALTDRQLVQRFTAERDEAAFAELVARHGALVFNVCRRMLRREQDAEDAFQATFLVLAKKAATIRKRESIAGWLYGVAWRCAGRLQRDLATRRRHELAAVPSTIAEPPDPSWRDVQEALHEELARLPEKYRAPLVLCYLEGRTQCEAARLLGWGEQVLRGRVDRGRDRLRQRLTRRGITLSAALLAAAVLPNAPASAALIHATQKAAMLIAAGQSVSVAATPTIAALVDGTARVVGVKAKLAILVLLAGIIGGTLGLASSEQPEPVEQQAKSEAQQNVALQKVDVPKPGIDSHGDPLPEGAVARLGTVRWRRNGGYACLAFSPDGKTVVTGGSSLQVWDLATGKELRHFAAPNREDVDQLIFADEGKALVGTGTGGNVYVWDAATGRELRHISGPPVHYYPGGFHPDVVYVPKARLVVSTSGDHAIHIWDFDTGKEIRALKGHSAAANYLALSADGKTLASASGDGSARLWDIHTGKELRTLFQNPAGPRGNPECVCFSPDGRTVMTSERNGLTRIWDVATGKEICRLKGQFWLNDAVFKSDGKTLITEDAQTIRYWSTATGEELRRFERHSDDGSRMARGNRLALSPDEKILASAGSDSKILLWNTETGKPINEQGHAAQVSSLAYSPDGKMLATAGHDNTVRVWDVRTRKQIRAFAPFESRQDPLWLNRIEFSSLGKLLVTEEYAQLFVSVCDPIAGKVLYRRKSRYGTFSPDGKLLALVEGESGPLGPPRPPVIRLYDAATGALIREMRGPYIGITSVAFLPDGKTLVMHSSGFAVPETYWDVGSGTQIGHSNKWLPWGTISPDGRMVAWSDPGPQAGDWIPGGLRESASGQTRHTFSTHSSGYIFFSPLAFSPDGRMLAAVDSSYKHPCAIRLWELPSCKELGRLDGHRGRVTSLAFAPDGKSLASGSWDTSVLIWDVTPYRSKIEQVRLDPEKLPGLWQNLGSDAKTAYRAFADLVKSPEQAIGLIGEHLHPEPALDQKEIARLLSDLDSDEFAVREKASAALEAMGTKVESALRKALASEPSPEARRRIESLSKKLQPSIPPAKELREIRAVEVLEYIATPEARKLLQKLAAGAPEARLTREAKAALERLNRQK